LNTIGSKANDAVIAHAVVQAKAELEKSGSKFRMFNDAIPVNPDSRQAALRGVWAVGFRQNHALSSGRRRTSGGHLFRFLHHPVAAQR